MGLEPSNGHEDAARTDPPSLRPRDPALVVAEDRTPLPQVDQALPILSLFAALVGRGARGRYRIALLKTLASSGAGRWKIRQIQEAVWWLEPASVVDLVSELSDAGVLAYDPQRRIYTLPPTSRIAAAIIDALTFEGEKPERIVQWLSAAIELSVQSDPEAGINSFAQAVAILRADVAELRGLMEDGALDRLLEAAEKIGFDADDMDVLLDRHETFRLEHADDPRFRELEDEAFRLSAHLHQVTAEVIQLLTGQANELMLGGARIDRVEIREFIEQATPADLAAILRGLAAPPPFIPWLPADQAFEQLLAKHLLERPEPLPLPEPQTVEQRPLTVAPDDTERMIAELLELDHEETFAKLAVRASWHESAARHTALLDAYVRDERAGRLPGLEFEPEVESIPNGPVARVSRVRVRPKERV